MTSERDDAVQIDGKPVWEHADTQAHDLDMMRRCCAAELDNMQLANCVPAPYYFERVANLLRRAKDYGGEVEICERYLKATQAFYAVSGRENHADVRKGPRYAAIVARLPKARALRDRAMPRREGT